MVKQAVLVCCVMALLAATSGCGVVHALLYCPFGPDAEPCGGACGGACGPACGPSCADGPCDAPCGAECAAPCGGRGRAAVCHDPCEESCDPCRNERVGVQCGPLSWLFAPFRCRTWCGGNCGERYMGDWYSDLPDCHDPCDQCGNYTGPGSTGYTGRGGYPAGAAPVSNGNCPHCNGGGNMPAGVQEVPAGATRVPNNRYSSYRNSNNYNRTAYNNRAPAPSRVASQGNRVVRTNQADMAEDDGSRVVQSNHTAVRQ